MVYNLGYAAKLWENMLPDIEAIVISELAGLCHSCVHHDGCVYRMNARKIVIQCEVFESAGSSAFVRSDESKPARGLCTNCSKRHFCHLPRETSGVWHCEEYE